MTSNLKYTFPINVVVCGLCFTANVENDTHILPFRNQRKNTVLFLFKKKWLHIIARPFKTNWKFNIFHIQLHEKSQISLYAILKTVIQLFVRVD